MANINKTMVLLFTMLFAGVLVWALIMGIHKSHAKAYDNQEISRQAQEGLKITPRGPGGPPVVHLDGEWQIKVFFYSAGPRGFVLTYGNPKDGPYRFDTEAECKKAKDGPDFKKMHGQILAQMKQVPDMAGMQAMSVCVHAGPVGERVD